MLHGPVILLAFAAEYVDSALGMGYGTALTPILLLLGFQAADVVPAVLLSELATGFLAASLHHGVGNVSFRRGSRDLTTALILGATSTLGAIAGVVFAINVSGQAVKLYIAAIVLLMGVLMFLRRRQEASLSWGRFVGVGIGLGVVASFNKGISGGGYGPLVTAGQILFGVGPKSAIAITSLAEALTCVVGVTSYLLLRPGTSWELAPSLLLGAVVAVPLSALTVRWIPKRKFAYAVAVAVLGLGALSLYRALV